MLRQDRTEWYRDLGFRQPTVADRTCLPRNHRVGVVVQERSELALARYPAERGLGPTGA